MIASTTTSTSTSISDVHTRRLAVVRALREANRPQPPEPEQTEASALEHRVAVLEQLAHRVATVERETATLRKMVVGLTGLPADPTPATGAPGRPGAASRRRAVVPALPDLATAGRALDGVLFGHPTEH